MKVICKCGHIKSLHGNLQPYYPKACLRKDSEGNFCCMCYEYQPDNLLHIERLAKKRGFIK
jgi:hypothetical protein